MNVTRHCTEAIVSFEDADTEALCSGRRAPRLVKIDRVARGKLRQLQIVGCHYRRCAANEVELKPVTLGELLREELLVPMGKSK